MLGGGKWEAAILGDSVEFRKRGLGNPGLAQVDKTLRQLPSPEASTGNSADVAAINGRTAQLFGQGKYKEAAALAEKTLALAERVLGPDIPIR